MKRLGLIDNGRRAVIVTDGQMVDAVTGAALGAAPANFEPLMVNNRLRGEIDAALAALKLASPDAAARLAAARALQGSDNEGLLPIVQKALDKETDPEVKGVLELSAASLALKNADPALRAKAAADLAKSNDPQVRQVLSALVAQGQRRRLRGTGRARAQRGAAVASPKSTAACSARRSAWRRSPD